MYDEPMLDEPLYPPQDNIPADTTARVADTWLSFMSSPPFQRWCPRGRNGGSDCSMPRRWNNLVRPSVEEDWTWNIERGARIESLRWTSTAWLTRKTPWPCSTASTVSRVG